MTLLADDLAVTGAEGTRSRPATGICWDRLSSELPVLMPGRSRDLIEQD
jgi:hypothetical protein